MSQIISFEHIYKGFRLYHEQKNSIFELVTSFATRKSHLEHLKVLEDISFSVNRGETFGIVGNNGSGKTTILKLISNIYKPDKGTIKAQGQIVPLLQLGIGFHPELTAIDNIITYGILLGFTKKWIKSKIPEILQYAELEKFSDTKIKNFSSGMYSRLAFSTAIQVDPDILLVDEVLAVGDVSFQKKCLSSFDDFKKSNKTIVFVSNDMHHILNICDRVLLLKNNKIEKIGNPEEVVNYYTKLNTRS